MDTLLRGVVAAQGWIVRPLQSADPLAVLTSGELVGWSWVATAFLIKVIAYSGLLVVITTWFFNRREIGLPT
jgi:hypothetical protein